jgi:hypothetical protein
MKSSVPFAHVFALVLSVASVRCGRERDTHTQSARIDGALPAPSASAPRLRAYPDPFAFPARGLAVAPGTSVLAPSPGTLRASTQAGLEPITLAYTLASLEKAGDVSSELEWLTEQRGSVPNALIIPLTPQGRARRGEVVVTSGVSGSGLERAIVTSDGESATPSVRSLDVPFDRAVTAAPRVLASGSYRVVADTGDVGTTLACEASDGFEPYVLAASVAGRWLGVGFAGRARVLEPNRCRLLPVAVSPRLGTRVSFPLAGRFVTGDVVGVDLTVGRIRVNHEFGGVAAQAEVGFVNVATEAL